MMIYPILFKLLICLQQLKRDKMSIKSDFDLAWKDFEKSLLSIIIKNTINATKIDVAEINKQYKNIIYEWEKSYTICGLFLSSNNQIKSEFMNILNNFEFKEEKIEDNYTNIYIVSIIVSLIIGLVIGLVTPETNWFKEKFGNVVTIIFAMIFFGSCGCGIAKTKYEISKSQMIEKVKDEYMLQVNKLHEQLSKLCK